MSTAAPSKPLKRLSLLQSPTTSSVPSPPCSSCVNPGTASIRDSSETSGFPAGAEAPPSWSLASPTSHSSISAKQSRRHSSIYYISQVRDNNAIPGDIQAGSPLQAQRTSQLHERNASSLTSNSRAKDENCVQSSDIPVKVSTLTLAEKHADLLRFIAQKEAKCLELRSQLVTHEAELSVLKRKWERIVSRGYEGGPTSSISSLDNDGSSQGAVISGLKEGVQEVGRLLMQLGDIGAHHSSELGHGSNSSISTASESTNSTRMSQSSMSSIGLLEEINEENAAKMKDIKSIDTKIKRHSLSTPIRRRPYEPSSPSTSSPSIMSPRTPLSASGAFTTLPSSSKQLRTSPLNQNDDQTKHKKQTSMSQSSFPPISSIPGVNVAPLASWVDSVGRRLGQLHNSQTASSSGSRNTSQSQLNNSVPKRASTLLSDASNTFFAALGSPSIDRAPSSASVTSSSRSLLDDDDLLGSDSQCTNIVSLSPERVKPRPTPIQTNSSPAMKQQDVRILTGSDVDSEEWNW